MEDLGAVGSTAVAEPAVTETPSTETPSTDTGGGVPETPVTETTEGAEPAEGVEPAPEGGEEDDLSSVDGGGAPIDKQIAALKKTNPAAAKAWAKDHYSLKAFQAEFPSVQEARAAKASIESLGGEEGITSLQEEVTDYRGEIEQFSNGDPALLTQLYEANPDALVTAGQNLLQLLSEKDLQKFDAAMIPSMDARLENAGMYEAMGGIGKTLQQVEAAIKEGDGQRAYDLLRPTLESFGKVNGWLGKLRELASKNGEKRAQKDPERESLERERQEFNTQKAQEADRRIGENVNKLNNDVSAKIVEPFFKEINLSRDGRKVFVDRLNSQIYDAMKKDKTFQRQAKAIKAKGDPARTSRFISAKFAELLPDSFRSLRNALYPNYKPLKTVPKPAATNGATNGAKPAPVAAGTATQKPNRDDVDWDKTDITNWIAGKGIVLKNGKTINLDWKAVR